MNKIALVLGITLIGLMGAAHYLRTQDDTPLGNLRGQAAQGIEDLADRVALFKDWMQEHKRSYGLGEVRSRFAVWNKVYDDVLEHNAKGLSWEAGLNQFSDLTEEEFASVYLGYKHEESSGENVEILDETGIPATIDWRDKGAVTAVKNQGSCGSCYTFSATGALEGAWFLKNKTLVSLSEQQILDCSKSYGNQGCDGGLMVPCFKYTKDKGIMKASDYKYTAKVETCKANTSKALFKNKNYIEVQKNSSSQLKAAVAKVPIAVAVEAGTNAWKNYKSGIISSNCGTKLDHAVLAVGYGSNFWIVKNSWGASWGEKGYVRVSSGTQNNGAGVCGINMENSYPTL